MFAGKPCTGRETNPCRKLRIPRTCTGCCRVKKVPAWQVALIPSWSWLHMTEKGPHNKIITAGWWSPKRRTLLPVQIMKVSQQIFGWENFSVASNGQGPEIWHIFFKNHSSRTNKTETTQPSHSPWTPWNKQEINNNLQCIVLLVLYCFQFQKLGSCPFSEPFPGNKLPSPTHSRCVTTKHFEWVILNDNYANKGKKLSNDIWWGFVLKEEGGEASKISKLAWIFPHPLFKYELPKKNWRGGWQESASSSSGIVFAAATNRSKITKLANWKMHGRTQQTSHPLPYGWLGWVVLSSPNTLCDA